MITITLPDGAKQQFAQAPTGKDIAGRIGAGLAKAAIAVKVDKNLYDLTHAIDQDCMVEIITLKSQEALDLLRHDCAHILAQAVQELYSGVKIAFGPAIENGFYYDFQYDRPFNDKDFFEIEKKMAEIIDRDLAFEREIWNRDDAVKHFRKIGEHLKADHIESLPENEQISIYRQGDWLDLCRGPHMPSTGYIGKAFKLMSIAGSYWKGNSDGPQLQRVYGTCWRNQKELDDWLHRLEQAKLRD
ncbi:MAG: TGS domain-containing protein, partial [Pseudomonadota bacterium]